MNDKIERPKNEPARIKNARLARKAQEQGVKVTIVKGNKGGKK